MTGPQSKEKLEKVPKVPKEFGEDGGHFYRYYDDLAEKLDDDMVTRLKTQLDGILFFAGLFAGVNSAFLGLTLPEMRADPADDTNALLIQLVTGGNGTIRSADDLPSATFNPSPALVPVNVLFSLSLTLTIIISFLAVLGQQWLVYYRKQSGGGAEYQRWEQLRRYLGAHRWRLEAILDDVLPALLQLALAVFCVAFVLYVKTLSKTIYCVIITPMAMAMAILFLMAIAASWDQWCPFKSPLSHLLQLTVQGLMKYRSLWYIIGYGVAVFGFVMALLAGIIILAVRLTHNAKEFLAYWLWSKSRSSPQFLSLGGDVWRTAFDGLALVIDNIPNPGEGITRLQAEAAKRVLCTSEDSNALIYTGINLQAMKDRDSARHFLSDDAVHKRLEELVRSSEELLASVFSHTHSYLLWGGQSVELFVDHHHRQLYSPGSSFPLAPQYIEKPHPLKTKVKALRRGLETSTRSFPTEGNRLEGLLLYVQLLEIILSETYDGLRISKVLHKITTKQALEPSAPLVISLVAKTVCILNEGIKSAPSSGHALLSSRNQNHLLVQRQRVKAVKELVSEVGWDAQSCSADGSECDWSGVLNIIQKAFSTYSPQSPRQRGKEDVWLLEQAFFISISSSNAQGLADVLNNCIDMLCAFDKLQAVKPDLPSGRRSYREDNHFRCTKVLSECLQVTQKENNYRLWYLIAKNLNKLVNHLKQLVIDFKKRPSPYDASTLSSWLKIRDILEREKAREGGDAASYVWYQEDWLRFLEVYPHLKAAVRNLEVEMQKASQGVDGNLADPPLDLAMTPRSRQAELREASAKESEAIAG